MTPEREKIIRDTWQAYGGCWPRGLPIFNAPAVSPISFAAPMSNKPVRHEVNICTFTIERGHKEFGQLACWRVVCEGVVVDERCEPA